MKAIGLMSGTSLDGLDICLCDFTEKDGIWAFSILTAETIPYNPQWQERLTYNGSLSANELLALDHDYGILLGNMLQGFLQKNNINAKSLSLISTHGHTYYHRPEQGFTFQLGNGPELFAKFQIPVVCDFRRQDVAMGGQGAPLVPIGDQLLFHKNEACLNFGGFANISFAKKETRIAFDICPVNYVLNSLAKELGYDYDYQGLLASKGEVNSELLERLNTLPFYKMNPPKSLGAEWVNEQVFPWIQNSNLGIFDKLRTMTEHVAIQVTNVLNEHALKNCIVTGGGAYNAHLIQLIRSKTNCLIHIPDKEIVEYKEALIFAFMGLLRLQGKHNVIGSVTGAPHSHSSGIIYS
ncbi:anhydro-N-acetylmuramic acid kinase [Owenweeksia hongkongensis]|uniref:anhydro-N-acetylmuramic acid kinase n=1 Tax=Owenweeksia hongkongensis TaxID=253245 RepID=UPI003A8D61F1